MQASRSAAVVLTSCLPSMTSAVRIPWAAAKTASCGPSASARRSEENERTVRDESPELTSADIESD